MIRPCRAGHVLHAPPHITAYFSLFTYHFADGRSRLPVSRGTCTSLYIAVRSYNSFIRGEHMEKARSRSDRETGMGHVRSNGRERPCANIFWFYAIRGRSPLLQSYVRISAIYCCASCRGFGGHYPFRVIPCGFVAKLRCAKHTLHPSHLSLFTHSPDCAGA